MARQKEFDCEDALQEAMEVFWSRGYQAASIEDLVKHMGINRQSLYDTFGDKHGALSLLRAPGPGTDGQGQTGSQGAE